ncbi:MAG: hypothetical protein ACT4OE_10990, partial [Sphingosinicella sp.]
ARRALAGIGERIDLDFFGLDCSILADGRMLLFECNATMNFFPLVDDPRLEHVRACLAPAQRAFHRLLFGERVRFAGEPPPGIVVPVPAPPART